MPADIIEAVEGYLQTLLVPNGTLTWVGSGKLPPNYTMPYCVVGDIDEPTII